MTAPISRRAWLSLAGGMIAAPLLAACGALGVPTGIYLMPVDGAPRWIGAGVGAPAWSADGEQITWGDESGLWRWRQGTSEAVRVVETRVVARPAWAPDASAIAFVDAASSTLLRVAPDGSSLGPLATIATNAAATPPPLMQRGGPAWSPDGETIAFVCWDGAGDELCLVDAAGNRRQEITSLGQRGADTAPGTAGSSVVGMAWSPDSAQIAVGVQAEQRGATAGVYLVELAERSGRRISMLVPNSPMSWSQASSGILFSAAHDGRSDAFLLDPVTRTAEVLTAGVPEGVREAAMSKSGLLAAVSGDSLVLVEGGAGRTLPVGSLAVSNPAWNPDGVELAVVASETPIQNYR